MAKLMSYPYEPTEQPAQRPWREGIRRPAVVIWVAFIGGVFAMPLLLWVDHSGLDGFGDLTIAFLLAWLLASVPASLAVLLLQRPGKHRSAATQEQEARDP